MHSRFSTEKIEVPWFFSNHAIIVRIKIIWPSSYDCLWIIFVTMASAYAFKYNLYVHLLKYLQPWAGSRYYAFDSSIKSIEEKFSSSILWMGLLQNKKRWDIPPLHQSMVSFNWMGLLRTKKENKIFLANRSAWASAKTKALAQSRTQNLV